MWVFCQVCHWWHWHWHWWGWQYPGALTWGYQMPVLITDTQKIHHHWWQCAWHWGVCWWLRGAHTINQKRKITTFQRRHHSSQTKNLCPMFGIFLRFKNLSFWEGAEPNLSSLLHCCGNAPKLSNCSQILCNKLHRLYYITFMHSFLFYNVTRNNLLFVIFIPIRSGRNELYNRIITKLALLTTGWPSSWNS